MHLLDTVFTGAKLPADLVHRSNTGTVTKGRYEIFFLGRDGDIFCYGQYCKSEGLQNIWVSRFFKNITGLSLAVTIHSYGSFFIKTSTHFHKC